MLLILSVRCTVSEPFELLIQDKFFRLYNCSAFGNFLWTMDLK